MTKRLVAVYGTLKKGFGNHKRHLQECECLGTTRLKPEWTMYHLGGFPALVHGGTTAPVVEVYEVEDDDTFSRLDMLEGYPSLYNRMLVPTDFGMAWVYFMEGRNMQGYPVVADGNYQG